MSYAIVSSGIVAREELGNGDFVSPEGISTSWQSVGLWSGAERMAAGIYEVQEVVPAGREQPPQRCSDHRKRAAPVTARARLIAEGFRRVPERASHRR